MQIFIFSVKPHFFKKVQEIGKFSLFKKKNNKFVIYVQTIGLKCNFSYINNLTTFYFSYNIKTISPRCLKIKHKRKNIASLNVLKFQVIKTSSFDFIRKNSFWAKNGVSDFIDFFTFWPETHFLFFYWSKVMYLPF